MTQSTGRTLRPKVARVFLPLLAPRRYKGAKGGRGSGKSHFFAELAVMTAISSHNRILCAREIQNSIDDSVKQLIEDKIDAHGLRDQFKITDTEIVYPAKDSLFIFRGLQSHTASRVKSIEGFSRCWVEEAQTISQKSINALTPTLRKDGSELWFGWNPIKPTDPVERLFSENANDPDFALVEANYWDNPWFPDALRKDMERDRARDPDKYANIWCGAYESQSEARVFRNWRIAEFETPANARFYFGADWGFSIDPTVLVRCFIEGRTLFVDYEAFAVGCEIDRTPALFRTVPASSQWQITADSARPETISYMQRNGFPRMTYALKGADSVKDGIEFLKSYDIVVHPRCKNTIRELQSYSFKVDRKTDEVLPVLEDKENHVIDALRYAVEGLRRASGVVHEELRL